MLADPHSPALPLLDTRALADLVENGAWQSGTFSPPPWLPRVLQLDQWLREYRVRIRL